MGGDECGRSAMSGVRPAEFASYAMAGGLFLSAAFARSSASAIGYGWPALLLPILMSVALVAVGIRTPRADDAENTFARLGTALMVGAMLLLAVPGATHPMAFFQRWCPSQPGLRAMLRSDALRWVVLTAAAALVWPRLPGLARRIASITGAVSATLVAVSALLRATGGNALYRDDHASFLFRMWVVGRSALGPVAWVPFWEAGHVDSSAAVTGGWLLGLPVWLMGERSLPHTIYTPLAALAVILLPPIAAAIGARLAGLRVIGCAAASLLALGVSRGWFVWTLRFGTVPAGLSAAMFPLAAGVAARVLDNPRPSARHAAAWAAVLIGLVHWPLGTIMALPLALGLLISPSLWTPRRFVVLATGTAAAALALAPVVFAILAHAHVSEFVASPAESGLNWAAFARGARRLPDLVAQAHPLLIALGIAGAPLWPQRTSRLMIWTALSGLAILSLWGDLAPKELQLTRAQIPLLMLAILPAAHLLERLLVSSDRRVSLAGAAALGLLALGAYEVIRQYGNRTNTPYAAMGDEPLMLAEWIERNVPPGARVLFAGPTVHAYGGGHVAYLPVLSGRSMLACDFYHFSPSRREYEYPPRAFRANDENVFEFLDLYNIAAVITYHDHWLRFLRQHPDRFEEAARFGREGRRIAFLVRRPPPGLFLKNSGRVQERINGLDITLDDPHSTAVLRYRWAEGLSATPPARALPIEGPHGLQWIRIEPNGLPEVRIRWSPWASARCQER